MAISAIIESKHPVNHRGENGTTCRNKHNEPKYVDVGNFYSSLQIQRSDLNSSKLLKCRQNDISIE